MKTMRDFAALILYGLLTSCSTPNKSIEELNKIEKEIIETEKAFSDTSEKKGFSKALAEYAADNGIKLNPGQYAVFGKQQLQKEAQEHSIGSNQGTITWKPLKIDIAESGDMAIAFGDWEFKFESPITRRDTTLYGNYVTVWKKQKDRTWKFIIDGGNPTPGPTTNEMLNLVK
jgi:ketosteroid isomerase-like protein